MVWADGVDQPFLWACASSLMSVLSSVELKRQEERKCPFDHECRHPGGFYPALLPLVRTLVTYYFVTGNTGNYANKNFEHTHTALSTQRVCDEIREIFNMTTES